MPLNDYRKHLPAVIYTSLVALLVSVYLECFHQSVAAAHAGTGRLSGWFTRGSLLRVPLIWLVLMAVFGLLMMRNHKALSLLHRYRWGVGAAVIVLLTVLRISGSSVALWAVSLGDGQPFNGTLWGIPRPIRSDEWATFTPISFSQSYTGYSAVSDIIHAAPTNVTLINAYPSWALATLFRPFLWGFMLLGGEFGLAFFWSARLVVLCLVSYEFARLLTRDNCWLAAAYAMLVAFAPAIQWWFAVNAIVEMFVFGQLLILLFAAYLRTGSTARRWLLALAMAYCATGYALVLYPAWQITMFFAFAACGIGVLADWVGVVRAGQNGGMRITTRGAAAAAIPLLAAVLASCILVGLVCWMARDAFSAIMHTSYPGARQETGGGGLSALMNFASSPFTALDGSIAPQNEPEQAVFYSLFPLGLVLAGLSLRRRRDPMVIALMAVDVVLIAFQVFGFPHWLARATLLFVVPTSRVKLAATFIDMLLIIRVISQNGKEKRRFIPYLDVVMALVFAGAATLLNERLTQVSYGIVLIALMVLFATLAAIPVFRAMLSGMAVERYVAATSVFIMVAGLCVNPIQHKADALTQSPTVAMVKDALQGEPLNQVKLVTDHPFTGQAMVGNGIPTISAVNSIPALDRWGKVDPQGKYRDVYNRYAYVQIDVEPNGTDAWFEIPTASPDYITAHIAADDLPRIGATHLLTSRDMSQYQTRSLRFKAIGKYRDLTLYRIES